VVAVVVEEAMLLEVLEERQSLLVGMVGMGR
jgi:hypothetical protein